MQFKDGKSTTMVNVWSLSDGRLLKNLTGDETVNCLTYSPEDDYFAGGSASRIQVWNASSKSTVSILRPMVGRILSLAVLPSDQIATGSESGSIRVWNAQNRTLKRIQRGHSGAVRSLVNLGGDELVSGSEDATIIRWSLSTGSTKNFFYLRRGLIWLK